MIWAWKKEQQSSKNDLIFPAVTLETNEAHNN